MTSDVAVAVAVAAGLLSLILLGVVIRQHRAIRALSDQVGDLRAAQQSVGERFAVLQAQQRDTAVALELALAALPADAGASAPEAGDPEVTLITDFAGRQRGTSADDDDLTTARIASVTLGRPLIKVAALSHGVRHALDEEQRMRISYAVRKELRRQRKIRRRRRAEQAPSKGWR